MLGRFKGERIVIRGPGGEVVGRLTVIEIRDHTGKVRLGFDFDKKYTVDREEVDMQKYPPPFEAV